jgi:NAD-dependent deacetylase
MVLCGSGVSAESGVPTFRDAMTGLWERYEPTQLATPQAFARDPALVWEWYRWRRRLVTEVAPNPAHYALAELEGLVPRLTLVTQNVDGLHQRAGSRDVVEFHGNLLTDVCSATDCEYRGHGGEPRDETSGPPPCPDCGAPLRPAVVWFGEAIPADALDRAFAAVADCNVFLSVGTSSLVYPAAGLAEQALASGIPVAEINPNPTPLTVAADHVICGPAGTVLPAIVEALKH